MFKDNAYIPVENTKEIEDAVKEAKARLGLMLSDAIGRLRGEAK